MTIHQKVKGFIESISELMHPPELPLNISKKTFSVKFYWRENVCDVTYFDYYSICEPNLMEIDM